MTAQSQVSGETPATPKVAVTLIDGQNLFGSAREAFGYDLPNYDALKISEAVCSQNGWSLKGVHFYTGVPRREDSYFWNIFWAAKNRSLGRNPIAKIFTRATQHRNKHMVFPAQGQTYRSDAARFSLPGGLPLPPGTQFFLPEGRVIPGEFFYHFGEEKGMTSASPWTWCAWHAIPSTTWR